MTTTNKTLFSQIKPMDLLRMYMGLALVVKGIYFISNMDAMIKLGNNIPMFDNFLAWAAVGIHVVCGLSLAIGFWTRMSAFLNFLVMSGAVLFVHAEQGLFTAGQQLEFTMLILFVLGLLVWNGSGKLSFDHLVSEEF